MVVVTVKKWGNSLGVILPKEVVDQKGIKEGDDVHIALSAETSIEDLFGSMPDLPPAKELLEDDGWD